MSNENMHCQIFFVPVIVIERTYWIISSFWLDVMKLWYRHLPNQNYANLGVIQWLKVSHTAVSMNHVWSDSQEDSRGTLTLTFRLGFLLRSWLCSGYSKSSWNWKDSVWKSLYKQLQNSRWEYWPCTMEWRFISAHVRWTVS